MTEAERYAEITSLLNKAGTLAKGAADYTDDALPDAIGAVVLLAWNRTVTAAEKEGREIVAAQPTK